MKKGRKGGEEEYSQKQGIKKNDFAYGRACDVFFRIGFDLINEFHFLCRGLFGFVLRRPVCPVLSAGILHPDKCF